MNVVSCQPYAPAVFTPQDVLLTLIAEGHSAVEEIKLRKNPNDLIWNQTRDTFRLKPYIV
jgi:hypothetical protein